MADQRRAFVDEYRAVRTREGWGGDVAWYRSLPYLDGPLWRVRARSFAALVDEVVHPLAGRRGRALQVADVGAGNGWLAYRLTQLGHRVAALDLLDDDVDGLGCHRHYPVSFTPVQADFEHLPLVDGSMDVVVFDGALHYATDLRRTLDEALRVLAPGGSVVVLDSPIYARERDGERMAARWKERVAGWGLRVQPAYRGYLTFEQLEGLADWRFVWPDYGLRWRLRPWWSRVRGLHAPARFGLAITSG